MTSGNTPASHRHYYKMWKKELLVIYHEANYISLTLFLF